MSSNKILNNLFSTPFHNDSNKENIETKKAVTNSDVPDTSILYLHKLNPDQIAHFENELKQILNLSLGETILSLEVNENLPEQEHLLNSIAKKCDAHLTLLYTSISADKCLLNTYSEFWKHKSETQPENNQINNSFENESFNTSNNPLTNKISHKSSHKIVNFYLIRRIVEPVEFFEVRVAVVGNVDAGKSTLLGVLTHGELDNGRGHSRQKLFRHKHEIESGRTSSVGNDILGFDSKGQPVNYETSHNGQIDWKKICQNAAKVITFIDLAGHEKYLKTTIFGMTGHYPDFVMLMIGANAGMVGMCKEHLGLALALGLPVFCVITKTDMCPTQILSQNLKHITKILKSAGCRKIPMFVHTMDDVIRVSRHFNQRTCPIFQVSNVSGQNMDLLTAFLNLLNPNALTPSPMLLSPPSIAKATTPLLNKNGGILTPHLDTNSNIDFNNNSNDIDISKNNVDNTMFASPNLDQLRCNIIFNPNLPGELVIDDFYTVPGVGTVISGTVLNGEFRVGDSGQLGPDRLGAFSAVAIRSIHRKRLPVSCVRAGQSASMALKKVRKSDVRKGMVLLASNYGICADNNINNSAFSQSQALNPLNNGPQHILAAPKSYWQFRASVLILHHPTTIKPKYQAMIHCGSIRQTATITEMTRECLRTGDRAIVTFRFTKQPEFMKLHQKLVFREGRTKAIGTIMELLS